MKKFKSMDVLDVAQGTFEWKKARMGYITATRVGALMGKGRGKDTKFSATAITMKANIAGERDLADDILCDEETFNAFNDLQCRQNAAMRHGHDCEPIARDLYATLNDVEVTECGQIRDKHMQWFAYSPDGLIINKAGNVEGIIEIKSPATIAACMKYRLVTNAEELKAENADYYYQCMTGLAITGAKYCDFIVFSAFTQHNKLHVVRIERDEDVIRDIYMRVNDVNDYILLTYGQG